GSPAMRPLRAQPRGSEAIVAATTRISAYSVVWLPVSSAPNRRGGMRAGDGTALAGMAAALGRGSGGQDAEGAGHGGDDGEQDEGGQEAEHQGEGEADGGPARFGLGVKAGAVAEGLGSGRQGLGRGGAPALGGLQGGGRGAQLVQP